MLFDFKDWLKFKLFKESGIQKKRECCWWWPQVVAILTNVQLLCGGTNTAMQITICNVSMYINITIFIVHSLCICSSVYLTKITPIVWAILNLTLQCPTEVHSIIHSYVIGHCLNQMHHSSEFPCNIALYHIIPSYLYSFHWGKPLANLNFSYF